MRKGKALRIAGFAGALCASAALVATSVSGTGAYFTDSQDGSLSASSGHLTLTTGGDTSLSFANLMPGDNQTRQFTYTTDMSSGTADVWLVFDPSTKGYQRFTGGKGSPDWTDGGLGRYGYFAVSDSNGGQAFRSGNLSFAPYGTSGNTHQPGDCGVDANGRGGSDWIATKSNWDNPPAYCGVPAQILLASNISSGSGGTVTVTFGLDGYMQTQQNQNEGTVGFKLVATQHGVSPADSQHS
jgi:hypothetical protein